MTQTDTSAAIAIGRNEGARLVACLASLKAAGFTRLIYVDSGSTDESVAAAETAGATVVALDMSKPFTAARARNAGVTALSEAPPDYVQFIDADCTLDPDWLAKAQTHLDTHPDIAVVCGRRRETQPNASVYNRLCDAEWDTPIGQTDACGGDALMRWSALDAVSGYNPDLIAGEEPEMCYRMRQKGWKIFRLDAEMTLHDAAMSRFTQFWNRTRRAGFAFAQGASMYGRTPERYNVAPTRRALVWGLGIPWCILFIGMVLGPIAILLVLIYPLQILRLRRRFGWERAIFFTIGKFAEAQGVLEFHWRTWRRADARLIEYK